MPSPMSTPETIDHVITYCQYNRILTKAPPLFQQMGCRYSDMVNVDNFWFDCNNHDTGNSLRVFIFREGQVLEIINTTFWFSSSYTFNKSKWEEGAWSNALSEAFNKLRLEATGHLIGTLIRNAKLKKEKEDEERKKIEFFEELFK